MLKYVCKMCGMTFEHHTKFLWHLREKHNLSSKDYFDNNIKTENDGKCKICGKTTEYINFTKGYREFCSVSCANKQRNINISNSDINEITCKICHQKLYGKILGKVILAHLKSNHNINSVKEYYDNYLKKENEGKCLLCGKPTEFRNIHNGYDIFCNASCMGTYNKNKEDSSYNILKKIKSKKQSIEKIINEIKEKYNKFISGGDKLKSLSDIRENPIDCKNVSDVNTYIDPENTENKVIVKTEISCNSTYDWVGTQDYIPSIETCNTNKNNKLYDNIDDEQSFLTNEWC